MLGLEILFRNIERHDLTDVEYTSGITITLKAGPAQDAPWISIRGTDPEHAFALLDEAQQTDLYSKVADAHNQFTAVELIRREMPATVMPQNGPQGGQGGQGGYNRQGQAQGGYSNRQAPPQGGQQQAPQGPPATHDLVTVCRHGEKNYVSGISQKTGKPWFGFDCPSNFKTAECARFAKVNG
ncbi:hypothetical protein [Kitasatospora sp. NPDC056800]|uniref:hypothetical protein n=1 Tax=Kitasatospora sp. NPDC056800 TaxID=3345948 RepID=UPI0036B89E87